MNDAQRAARQAVMQFGDLLSGSVIDQFIEKKLLGSDSKDYRRIFRGVVTRLLERKMAEMQRRNEKQGARPLDGQD